MVSVTVSTSESDRGGEKIAEGRAVGKRIGSGEAGSGSPGVRVGTTDDPSISGMLIILHQNGIHQNIKSLHWFLG